jgi:hypothetical protein
MTTQPGTMMIYFHLLSQKGATTLTFTLCYSDRIGGGLYNHRNL